MASLDNLIDVPETDQVLQNTFSIENLKQKVGSGNLTTTNNTLIGGLNEIHSALSSTQTVTNGNLSSINQIQSSLGEQSLPENALSIKHAINQNFANIATKAENTVVNALENRVQTNENDIAPMKSTIGVDSLPVGITSLSNGVAVNHLNIASNVQSITGLQSLVGSTSLVTANQTLTSAINENVAAINLKSDQIQTNVRFSDIENTIGQSTFTGTLKNGITANTSAINSINTILDVNENVNKIQSLENSISTINSTLGSSNLSSNLSASTVIDGLNEVHSKTVTDASHAENKRQELDQKIISEIQRASGVETSLNIKIGDISSFSSLSSTVSGAIAALNTTLTNLNNTVNALNTLIRSQKTLIVSTSQDHRSTDLTSFSEIVIIEGGTLIVSYEQANAIHTKRKSNNEEWVLSFTNNENLKVLHTLATSIDVSDESSLSFNQLEVQSGTFVLNENQFLTLNSVNKTNSGTIEVLVKTAVDMSSTSLAAISVMRVRATLSLNVAQILSVNMVVEQQGNLTLVVTQESDLTSSSILSSANAITVSALLIATPQQISDVSQKITKNGNGSITGKIATTTDIRSMNVEKIDNLSIENNSIVTMTSSQAEKFKGNGITQSNDSAIRIIETSDSDFTSMNIETWKFDELLLQNTLLTLTPSQTDLLKNKSVSKSNSSIIAKVSQNTNLSLLDLSKANTISISPNVTIQINVGQAHLSLIKGSNSKTQLVTSGNENISLINVSVDEIHNSGNLRINVNQISIPIANTGTVILSLRTSDDYRSYNIDHIDQIELLQSSLVEFSDEQINGKTVISTNGSLKIHASKDLRSYSLPEIDTLVVSGNVVITTTQHNAIGSVSLHSGHLTMIANAENISTLNVSSGINKILCQGSVTATAQQFLSFDFEKDTNANINLISNATVDLTSKDLSIISTLTHTENTITLTSDQISKLSLSGGSLILHIVAATQFHSSYNTATSIEIKTNGILDYTANSNDDAATTNILDKITNKGTIILRNAYKAPTSNLTSGILKIPKSPISGSLSWPGNIPLSNGVTYTLVDNLSDPHGKTTTTYQWIKDSGQGYTIISGENNLGYTVQTQDIGTTLKLRATWTIDWFRTDNNDVYNNSLSPLSREILSEGRFVNNVGTGTIILPKALQDLLVGDVVSIQISDPDGVNNPTYSWKRDGVAIASGATYDLKPIDFGKTLSVAFSYTDSQHSVENGISAMSQLPSIVSSYENLPNHLEVDDVLPTVLLTKNAQIQSTQWYTFAHNGSKSSSLPYSSSTIFGTSGTNFYARVTLTDTSIIETVPISVKNHEPSGSLTVNGFFSQGQTLSISSTIQDKNLKSTSNPNGDVGVSDLLVQWYRSDDMNRTNKTIVSTSSTYTIVESDSGKYIHVEGTYSEGASSHTILSLSLYNNTNGNLTISTHLGTDSPLNANMLMTGDFLKATISDGDGIDNIISYVWKRNSTILGNSETYQVKSTDFNTTITCDVTYKDNLVRTDTLSKQFSLGSEPLLTLRDATGSILSGAIESPVILNVPTAFVGLPYQLFVNDELASSGTTLENTNIIVENPITKRAFVKVQRTNSDFKTTQTIKFASLTITTNEGNSVSSANIGSILKANVSGIESTVVSFYFDGIVISRGNLGLHVLTANDSGNRVHCIVEDGDGFYYKSPTYLVP